MLCRCWGWGCCCSFGPVGKDWNWDASAFQAEVAERQKELSAERQAQLAAIAAAMGAAGL